MFLKLDHLSDSSGEQVTDTDCQGSHPGFLISQLEVGQRTCISNSARWCCSCWRPQFEAHRPKKRAAHPWQLIRIPWGIRKACVQIPPQTNVIRLGDSRIGPGHEHYFKIPLPDCGLLAGLRTTVGKIIFKRFQSEDYICPYKLEMGKQILVSAWFHPPLQVIFHWSLFSPTNQNIMILCTSKPLSPAHTPSLPSLPVFLRILWRFTNESNWRFMNTDKFTNHLKTEWSEVTQSCLTLCDPMDCSLPGSLVHGIFQARGLEWVAISFSRGSSWPWDRSRFSRIAGRRFTIWATRESQVTNNKFWKENSTGRWAEGNNF